MKKENIKKKPKISPLKDLYLFIKGFSAEELQIEQNKPMIDKSSKSNPFKKNGQS
jgi:hypothetical protein